MLPPPLFIMKKLCLESAKRKYTEQRHEGTYHTLWSRTVWKGKWHKFKTATGEFKFTFNDLPLHRRKLAIRMANLDKHEVSDVPVGEQDFNLADKLARTAELSTRKTVIRRKTKV